VAGEKETARLFFLRYSIKIFIIVNCFGFTYRKSLISMKHEESLKINDFRQEYSNMTKRGLSTTFMRAKHLHFSPPKAELKL
jgi:hypothetical protein